MKKEMKKWFSCMMAAAMLMSTVNLPVDTLASDFSDEVEISVENETLEDTPDVTLDDDEMETDEFSDEEENIEDVDIADESENESSNDISAESSEEQLVPDYFDDGIDAVVDEEDNAYAVGATNLPSEIYLAQEGKTTCTLASATMMLRSRFYKSNNNLWKSITESALKSTAWINGSGLRHSWTYKNSNNSVSVSYKSTTGISSSSLKSLINNHSEGIVLYCGKLPHAVFLTDYDGDTFYCADPIQSYSRKRISLASSYLGKKYGSQAGVLKNVTAYWYINSYNISGVNPTPTPNPDPITTSPSIWKNSDSYTVGDMVKFTWNSVDHATGYWLVVWYKGEQIVTTQVSGSSEYTLYNLREGEYTAYITAYNDVNSMESSVSLSVRYPDGYEAISDGKYQICSALDNSSVVSIAYASKDDEANALLYANEHHTNQIFNFENIGDGYYKITAEHSGKSLDVHNNENESGANVEQFSCNNNANQQWIVREAGDGYFYIISKGNGLYLDVYGGEAKNDANIDTYSGHGGSSEKWRLIPWLEGTREIEDGVYSIQSALDSRYGLNVAGGSKEDEANIQLGLAEDKYKVTFCEDGSYKITNVNSQKSLDAYASDSMQGKKKGTNVQQYHENGNDNQKWILKPAGNGQYYIICISNGLYMDVYGGKEGDGVNIDLWIGNGNTCQKWIFVPEKKDLSGYSLTLSKDTYSYDGKEKTPDVTVKNGTATLVKDSDYTVGYANNINAGTATVTVTGTGKYTGKITKQFKINKADQNLTVSVDKTNLAIGEKAQIKANGQGQITYRPSAEDKVTVSSTGVLTGKQAGDATITITAAGTGNYNSATRELVIHVLKDCVGNKHTWDNGKVTKQATCTTEGQKTYTCTNCGTTKTENISKTSHKEVKDAAVAATCENTGKTEGSHCSVCGIVIKKQETVPATGHTEITKFEKKATCETEGYTGDVYCNTCGKMLKEGKIIEKLSHDWKQTGSKAATCTADGENTYTCTRCNKTKTEPIPATGHKWSTWQKLSDATALKPQKQQRTCTLCHTSQTRDYGSKLKSVMKVSYSSLLLRTKQTTSVLTVSGMAKGDYVLKVQSGNNGIVRVTKCTKDGKIQLAAQGRTGNTSITIQLAGGAVKRINVRVQRGTVKTTAIRVSFTKATLKAGTKKTISTTVTPSTSQEKVTYTTSNKNVATISANGIITGRKRGTVKITVKSGSKKRIITVTIK